MVYAAWVTAAAKSTPPGLAAHTRVDPELAEAQACVRPSYSPPQTAHGVGATLTAALPAGQAAERGVVDVLPHTGVDLGHVEGVGVGAVLGHRLERPDEEVLLRLLACTRHGAGRAGGVPNCWSHAPCAPCPQTRASLSPALGCTLTAARLRLAAAKVAVHVQLVRALLHAGRVGVAVLGGRRLQSHLLPLLLRVVACAREASRRARAGGTAGWGHGPCWSSPRTCAKLSAMPKPPHLRGCSTHGSTPSR